MSVQFHFCCVNLIKCTSYSKANNDWSFHVGVAIVALSMNRLDETQSAVYTLCRFTLFPVDLFHGRIQRGDRGVGSGPHWKITSGYRFP